VLPGVAPGDGFGAPGIWACLWHVSVCWHGRLERCKGQLSLVSFGSFVFLGLRYNSGIRQQSDADSYLYGEDGLHQLTDYKCSFACKTRKLCSVNLAARRASPASSLSCGLMLVPIVY
jgi:hypothetical protein